MAKNDIQVVSVPGGMQPVRTYAVAADTALKAGEPVKLITGEGSNTVDLLATGDPEIGTDIMVGITATASTDTATVAGEVDVYVLVPGAIYRCAAHTPTNLAAGILYDTVTFDLTSTVFTINENEGSDEDVHGLRIESYNTDTGDVDFSIKVNATKDGALVA